MLDRAANSLKKVVSPASRWLGYVSMAAIVFVVLLVAVGVLSRTILNIPIHGSGDLSTLAFSLIVFLSLGWCALMDGHLELDLITKKLPKTARKITEVIMMFISTVTTGVVSWRLVIYAIELQDKTRETAILGISLYPFVYLAALGCLMLALVFFIRFMYSLSNSTEKR